MKTTIFGVLLDVTPEHDTILCRLMRKYGFMFRVAFQRLSARGDRTKQGSPVLRVSAGPDHWVLEISLDCLKPGKPDAKVRDYPAAFP